MNGEKDNKMYITSMLYFYFPAGASLWSFMLSMANVIVRTAMSAVPRIVQR